ncbi:hypothetical protein Taro_002030 [Colocasia esculenta]|uniref:Uncharacterized protein n=1 Tax=Colocasia esculenta TaxID=4460 RepID=A0A843THZ3_COLES|nr:hypothetical protein [Colocasia esculenta]
MRWCRVGGARRDSHPCRGKLVGRVLVAPWFSVTSCCRARSTGRDSVLSCCAVWSSDVCQGGRCWGLKAQAGYPFPLSLLFFPFPSSPVVGRLPFSNRSVVAPAGSWRRRGACVERGGVGHPT